MEGKRKSYYHDYCIGMVDHGDTTGKKSGVLLYTSSLTIAKFFRKKEQRDLNRLRNLGISNNNYCAVRANNNFFSRGSPQS